MEFLTYNFNDVDTQKLDKILTELMKSNIFNEYKLTNTLVEEDIIAVPAIIAFIKIKGREEKQAEINEMIEAVREYSKYIFITDEILDDKEYMKKFIIKNYNDYMNHKIYNSFEEHENGRIYGQYTNFIDAIIGFAVGDAMGVPVEFKTRDNLKQKPVTDMIGEGTYNMPKGVWSDDTSMTLATIDSLIQKNEINTNDIADRFLKWYRLGEYTATDEVFDVGNTTRIALEEYCRGEKTAEDCGMNDEMSNGNGSLMRILPIAFYLHAKEITDDKEIYEIVKKVSSITHAHEISIMGCYIYVKLVLELLDEKYKDEAYKNIQKIDYSFFSNETIEKYSRILKEDITKQKIHSIKSTGYVVDTLEAVMWLFLNAEDYNNTILNAVNLGNDTDTIAAITGGLLGIYYGIDAIKQEWKSNLKKYEYIKKLSKDFEEMIENY